MYVHCAARECLYVQNVSDHLPYIDSGKKQFSSKEILRNFIDVREMVDLFPI